MLLDLTVSIISTNNLEQLLPCLQSLFENTRHITLEVFVVDNASTDDTAETIKSHYPGVSVIRNDQRLGFSTNNNQVLQRGRGRYFMLLNDDTLILDGSLDALVAFADLHPDVGILGSFLLNPDGTFQPAFSHFPNPWIEGFWSTSAAFPRLKSHATMPFETDTVCGAALMIRRETMEQIGLLDTQFDPIYAEETDWCYRAKLAGWRVFSQPKSQIIHYGGYTMNRTPIRKVELLQMHKVLFFRKYHSRFAVDFFKFTLCVSSLVKFLFHSMLAHKPEHKHRAEINRYLLTRVPEL